MDGPRPRRGPENALVTARTAVVDAVSDGDALLLPVTVVLPDGLAVSDSEGVSELVVLGVVVADNDALGDPDWLAVPDPLTLGVSETDCRVREGRRLGARFE